MFRSFFQNLLGTFRQSELLEPSSFTVPFYAIALVFGIAWKVAERPRLCDLAAA
jgi:hypothetical protein